MKKVRYKKLDSLLFRLIRRKMQKYVSMETTNNWRKMHGKPMSRQGDSYRMYRYSQMIVEAK